MTSNDTLRDQDSHRLSGERGHEPKFAKRAEAGDNFGHGVAISGDTAFVGADREDAGAAAAYVFYRNEAARTITRKRSTCGSGRSA